MKPTALALLVTTLLSACTTSATEERAAAHRAAVEQEAAARQAASASAAAASAVASSSATDPSTWAAAPTEEHAWLQQLVGEWTFACKASMGAGQPAMEMSGTESVKPVGGLWIVAVGHSQMGGLPIESRMTLGYQPDAKAFVGTWLDSSQTQLWSYKGALDADRKTLTLDTEGPSFDDPSRTSRYRDAIELTDKHHKVLTSSVLQADGSWMTFMRAEFTRTK